MIAPSSYKVLYVEGERPTLPSPLTLTPFDVGWKDTDIQMGEYAYNVIDSVWICRDSLGLHEYEDDRFTHINERFTDYITSTELSTVLSDYATTQQLSGKADLINGLIPSTQLPSFVDDVIEVANYAALPVSGEAGKIYLCVDTNLIYRWGGTVWAEISSSLALGILSTTAFRGDYGNIAYNHSQSSHAYLSLSGGTVNGNILATGEVQAYYSSDRLLKTNIKDFTALGIIDRLAPKVYNWNEKAKELNSTKDTTVNNYGLIAQELQEVMPELVKNIYNREYLAIDYIQLVPILIQAVKEQQIEFNNLKERLL